MAADRDGNIFYVYNGSVPRRPTKFDWSKPVDGSNPEAEWQGYHTFNELPQLMNPKTGFMQNCNQTPFATTADGSKKTSNGGAAVGVAVVVQVTDSDAMATIGNGANLDATNVNLLAELGGIGNHVALAGTDHKPMNLLDVREIGGQILRVHYALRR